MRGLYIMVSKHFLAGFFLFFLFPGFLSVHAQQTNQIVRAEKLNATTIRIEFSNQEEMLLDFYDDNIFRMYMDTSGNKLYAPRAIPRAQILADDPREEITQLLLEVSDDSISISTEKISVSFNKENTRFRIFSLPGDSLVLESLAPIAFEEGKTVMYLSEKPDEYFYGGGVQNGRFSHKGEKIVIENQNSWTDGGVASPNPFYWSTNGYGLMWHTFKKGVYDFGAKLKGIVRLSHETDYLDVFFMIDEKPANLLNDFYQLTGHPVLIPKFGFYEGHLNAYNRDYWKQDSTGILFEDGHRYRESQKDKGGIKESLNGEKNNYQFSARAVIDRYAAHDMPLGWILTNDGYGAGYGQTSTLDSNILNLKNFGDYARQHGVQIGLWTQSDLHPKAGVSALLQRDLEKEVGIAGVRVLKTDVAWVGPGYSFGLNGVSDAAQIMTKQGNNARPFIITLDGWAGTQRYATVWTGDQTGGEWEYIRFHIPTYIGSGLSGQPNITSDVDGIFGGKNPVVNTRDFQWKTFTPMQLNMDGWGSNPKYPQALGEPATSINRHYLKLKSALLPYSYSIAREAVDGLPMIRAMFLEYPNPYTYGTATQYQFMYGPYFLVAPIYKNTQADANGNDIRNGIYLPEGIWIDYFSGEQYEGGRIINNYGAPIWKLPVFVKAGAIIPMNNPNNHVAKINRRLRIFEIYPSGKSTFTLYNDDGRTEDYKSGAAATTLIQSEVESNTATVTVHPAEGDFAGFVKEKITEFRINVTEPPSQVALTVGGKRIKLKEAKNQSQYDRRDNVYFYKAAPNLNKFATEGSSFEEVVIRKNPQLWVKVEATDITENAIVLEVNGFEFSPKNHRLQSSGKLSPPKVILIPDSNSTAYSLKPIWQKVSNADFYEIRFDSMLYSTISNTFLPFENLKPETEYTFQIRAVNKDGRSEWASFTGMTDNDPFEFAIRDILGKTTVPNQEGEGIAHLFDFDESSLWHTKWGTKAVPFDMVIDLQSINTLDRMEYLPRSSGNGILLKGKVYYSGNKEDWNEAGNFEWEYNGKVKVFKFDKHPVARYIKVHVEKGRGAYGSGRELYIFKVPGTESIIPGDINQDGHIDGNDLTSYINYTGLRNGDGNFDGYVSKGDVNKNGWIDAYDISNVATQLEGGISGSEKNALAGTIALKLNKETFKKGEIAEIEVYGNGLHSVNALSFVLPYEGNTFEFMGIVPKNMKQLRNYSNNRLHSDGYSVLYPTFVNVGNEEALQGSDLLFVIWFKAKKNGEFPINDLKGILVDKEMDVKEF